MKNKVAHFILTLILILIVLSGALYAKNKYQYKDRVIKHIDSHNDPTLEIYSIDVGWNKFGFFAEVRFKDEKNVVYYYEINEKLKKLWQSTYVIDEGTESDLIHLENEESRYTK